MIFLLLLIVAPLCLTIDPPYGKLKVNGTFVTDSNGTPVQLIGMSLFWSQEQTPNPFFNFGTLRHLKKYWNSNIVRAPLGIVDLDGHPGYLNNTEVEYEKMKAVIDGAIQNNIYVIVDWHDHQANLHLEKAKEFFKNISQIYGNDPHIIYEIWNEPDRSVNWTDIKAYSNVIIPIIRANAPDSLILVGAPTFAQDVDIAAADPLNYQNIAYTLHYYAAVPEHQQYLRNKALAAINLGKCVFISEYGTVWYTGGGAVDEGNSTVWWDFNDQYKLSYVNWAIWTNNPSLAPNMTGANALTQGTTNNQMGMPSHWTTSGALVNKKYQTTNQGVKGNCPSSWYQSDYNNNTCYNYINQNFTWTQASFYCNFSAQHALLTSIANASENSEVLGVVTNYAINCTQAYIGLQKIGSTWTWANGNSLSYANWETGYPTNDNSSLCAAINNSDGKWKNVNCNVQQCFVCEVLV